MPDRLWILLCLLVTNYAVAAQSLPRQNGDTSNITDGRLVSAYIKVINSKAGHLDRKLDKYSAKALAKVKKQEDLIIRKLAKTDSLKAASIFSNAQQQYQQLEQKLQGKTPLQQYIPTLDTLSSSIKFLQQNPQLLSNAKEAQQKLKEAMDKVSGMEGKLQKAEEVKNFLKARKEFLKKELNDLGFAKELKKLHKQSFYFGQQLAEYKSILKDRKKAERKALALLNKSKLWQKFMLKNSRLASLFRLPDPDNPVSQASLTGLQTRTTVNNLIQQQIATGGPNAQQQFQQNIQQAQSQLSELKNKINKMGGGSSDDEMPEGFKANQAKTLSFIKRIKLNADFQTTRHNKFFPVNSDVGFSLSYLLNSNSHFSLGTSFKMGWGSGFNQIRLSSQGASVRAGIDWRLKGNLFIAGNYEQNYFSEIRNIDQLRDYSSWKTACLFGLSKKYSVGKKRGGEMRLLYDVFYNRPPVRTQPLVIRIGYSLN